MLNDGHLLSRVDFPRVLTSILMVQKWFRLFMEIYSGLRFGVVAFFRVPKKYKTH